MTVTYTVGDTREVIKGIADGSVDFICSSPPFLALRSYVPADHESKGNEIGSERNPAEFIDMLLGLTAEWGRVLASHGSIAIELGDTYSGSGGAGGDQRGTGDLTFKTDDGRRVISRRPTPKGPYWPLAKSLALTPQLYAVALAYGINPLTGQPSPAGRWRVRNVIVWHRPNPAVGALGDKVRPSTSYIVVATRSAKRWFDLTAVRTQAQDERPRSTNGAKVIDSAEVLGGTGYDQRIGSNPAGAPPLDAWFDHHDGDLEHDTWTLTTQPSSLAHYAMWPAKLAERLILMMCPREVCRVCGEPRRRVEVSTFIPHGKINHAEAKGVRGFGVQNGEHAQSMEYGRATKVPTTLGWTDCGCDCPSCNGFGWVANQVWCSDCTTGKASYRPGLVLDPFAGTGTTLAVADIHGRDAIGIDLDPRNADLYPRRYDECKRALFGTPAPMPGQETFDFAI